MTNSLYSHLYTKILTVQVRKLILSGSFWAIAVCNVTSTPYNKIVLISQGYHSRTQGQWNCRGMALVWIQTSAFYNTYLTLFATGQKGVSTRVFRKGSRTVQKPCKARSSHKISFIWSNGEFERQAALARRVHTAFLPNWILSLKHQL